MKILSLALVTAALAALGWWLFQILGAGPQTAIHIDKDQLEQDRIEWVEQQIEREAPDDTTLDLLEYVEEMENASKAKGNPEAGQQT